MTPPARSEHRRLAVLASGTGTLLEAFIADKLPIALVVTDRPCRAEEVAEAAGLEWERVERASFGAGFDRDAYSKHLAEVLRKHDVDLVAMAGFGTIVSEPVFEAYAGRLVNTHPALLPAFKGWHAVEAALEAGVDETGCTVHLATLEVDEGPILAQERVPVLPSDTVESLHERIKAVERRLYPATLWRLLEETDDQRRQGAPTMRALLSVYDKTGLDAFARGLADLGVELVASGNTSRALGEAGIPHVTVESVTGSPEMLGGRVKTLHPRIHGGILADLDDESHRADLEAQGIEPISLVACNLYPFTSEPSIEMIDIGGPTMVRSAAKNHAHVAVVVDPADYGAVLDELRREGAVSAATRRRLARAAYAHTAAYDAAIVEWFDETGPASDDPLPPTIHLALRRAQELRYGENPHQHGARYVVDGVPAGMWHGLVQHGGRELSYLNLFDADAAWRLAYELQALDRTPAAVIVKHANPCGAAVASDLATAYQRAFEADPLSAFGGIVALPGHVDRALAEQIVSNPLADVLIAEGYDADALSLFAEKRRNMRPLEASRPSEPRLVLRQIDGGFLVQEPDRLIAQPGEWKVATARKPTDAELRDARLAWLVCARTSSNTIVLAKDGQVVGVGCGQQSRVDAAGLASRKADGRATGGAGASDAFFPFRDGLDAVCDSGVTVVVQPGGSLRDDEVVAAADERRVAMLLTGERHFRH